ncbi:ONECUT DNA binding-like protein, partial [Dinothrombium tinctorium]
MQITISQQLGLDLSTVGNFFMNARRRSQDKWLDDTSDASKNHSSASNSPSSSTGGGGGGGGSSSGNGNGSNGASSSKNITGQPTSVVTLGVVTSSC